VAVGAHLAKRIEIPPSDAGPIVDALSFLHDAAAGEPPVIGRRVAVYGGGEHGVRPRPAPHADWAHWRP